MTTRDLEALWADPGLGLTWGLCFDAQGYSDAGEGTAFDLDWDLDRDVFVLDHAGEPMNPGRLLGVEWLDSFPEDELTGAALDVARGS